MDLALCVAVGDLSEIDALRTEILLHGADKVKRGAPAAGSLWLFLTRGRRQWDLNHIM